MEKTRKLNLGINKPVTVLLILGLSTILFPLYMTIVIALKQPSEMTNSIGGILALPKHLSFSNFAEAIEVTHFWNAIGNSLIITVCTVVLAILIHSVLGYVLGRKMANNRFYKSAYYYVVSGMFVPFAVLMMPLIKETSSLHIANPIGVILLYIVFYMPMNTMLYSGYLKNIPTALEEAAHIDGATPWKAYWKVIFPLMKPMHATVAVLTALAVWNDVMTPLVIMSGSDMTTLPVAQMTFQTQFGTNYNLAFASYLLAMLPMLIFYVICQKQIMAGVVNGAVK